MQNHALSLNPFAEFCDRRLIASYRRISANFGEFWIFDFAEKSPISRDEELASKRNWPKNCKKDWRFWSRTDIFRADRIFVSFGIYATA